MVEIAAAGDVQTIERAGTSRRKAGTWLWLVLVVVLFGAPLFVGLGATDLENDESIYSFAVDMMVHAGDWLTPKSSPSETEPFLEKPPLKFWIVAAPIRLGLLPDNEFGLRFCDALMGTLAFLYVFAIGRALGGVPCGLSAVLVLVTHQPLVFEHGLRGNNMEAPLVLAYCGAVYHFLRWRASDTAPYRAWHVLAVGLFFVLGFMTKFVAVFFLPVILGLALLGREDRSRFLRDWRLWLASAATAALLIAPWFLYQYFRLGAELWRVMFAAHVYQRFTTYLDPGHLHPWHYYFSTLVGELQRTNALVVTAAGVLLVVGQTVRRRWPEGAIVLLWFAVPFALISSGSSKLYHYAYPFLPPLALCAGYATAVALGAVSDAAGWMFEGLDRRTRALVRRIVRLRWTEPLLLAVAALSLGVAVATWVRGGALALHIGDFTVVRNAGLMRPTVVAILALALAGRLVTCVRVALPLVVLMVVPVGAYRTTVQLAQVEDHPLRTLRDCLQPVAARHATDDPRGLGVYIEDDEAGHAFHYYLRGLGRWFSRPAGTSDATVYTAVYLPELMRPVLLSSTRYDQFMALVNGNDAELLDRSARKAGMPVGELIATAKNTHLSAVRFPSDVLLLPGPYAACTPPSGTARLH